MSDDRHLIAGRISCKYIADVRRVPDQRRTRPRIDTIKTPVPQLVVRAVVYVGVCDFVEDLIAAIGGQTRIENSASAPPGTGAAIVVSVKPVDLIKVLATERELHVTPSGATQPFTWAVFTRR